MDFLAEIVVNLLLVVGVYLFQWCVRHKEAAKAIFIVILMLIDIVVIFKYFR